MNRAGFTTIELVAVILLIGILSVTVIPKFISQDGFSEITYRERLVALLRLQQTRAMQQTNNDCHRVLITASRFGIPFSGTSPNCSLDATLPDDYDAIDNGYNKAHYGLSLDEIANANVSFSTHNLYFNNLGCASGALGSACGSGDIVITITGESTQQVCIESQGYIHTGGCD